MRRTRSTKLYDRGDVVLVNFVFSEETGVKRRPAVIVSSAAYHQGRQETIIAAITSNVDRMLIVDHLISQWREAGLIYPSVVTGLIRTIKRSMIARRLGSLGDADLEEVSKNLMLTLELATHNREG